MSNQVCDSDQWDRYWSYGNLHSFSQVYDGNYSGAIAQHWKILFAGLPNGSRILDIGTGNGALALLALEESDSSNKQFEIHGIDPAKIEPENQASDELLRGKLARIQFHAQVSAESLPYKNKEIDCCCSQYGLEYSDIDKSIPEIHRVLKPGGSIATISHHSESTYLLATSDEIQQLEYVLHETELLIKSRDVLLVRYQLEESQGTIRIQPTPELLARREIMKDAIEQIHTVADSSSSPKMLLGALKYIQEVFSGIDRVPANELLIQLEEASNRLVANLRRLQDMKEAAIKENDRTHLANSLQTCGFIETNFKPFIDEENNLIGWAIHAIKCRSSDLI